MYYSYMKQTTSKPHFTFSLIHAAAAINERLENALGEAGLSVAKQSALSKLAEAGEALTLGELAERLSCVRSNITQLIDRLEADGLVKRVADPADRRSVRAELTPLGREKHAVGQQLLEQAQREIGERISATELMGLESALDALE